LLAAYRASRPHALRRELQIFRDAPELFHGGPSTSGWLLEPEAPGQLAISGAAAAAAGEDPTSALTGPPEQGDQNCALEGRRGRTGRESSAPRAEGYYYCCCRCPPPLQVRGPGNSRCGRSRVSLLLRTVPGPTDGCCNCGCCCCVLLLLLLLQRGDLDERQGHCCETQDDELPDVHELFPHTEEKGGRETATLRSVLEPVLLLMHTHRHSYTHDHTHTHTMLGAHRGSHGELPPARA